MNPAAPRGAGDTEAGLAAQLDQHRDPQWLLVYQAGRNLLAKLAQAMAPLMEKAEQQRALLSERTIDQVQLALTGILGEPATIPAATPSERSSLGICGGRSTRRRPCLMPAAVSRSSSTGRSTAKSTDRSRWTCLVPNVGLVLGVLHLIVGVGCLVRLGQHVL